MGFTRAHHSRLIAVVTLPHPVNKQETQGTKRSTHPRSHSPLSGRTGRSAFLWRDDRLMQEQKHQSWTRPRGHWFKRSLHRAGSRYLERLPDPSKVTAPGLCPGFPELQSGHPSLFPAAPRLSTPRLSTGAWASLTFSQSISGQS